MIALVRVNLFIVALVLLGSGCCQTRPDRTQGGRLAGITPSTVLHEYTSYRQMTKDPVFVNLGFLLTVQVPRRE